MTGAVLSPPDAGGRIARAILWMLGAIVSFTVMAIAGRGATRGMDPLQVTVWRSLIGFVVLVGIVLVQGGRFRELATRRGGLHVLRNAVHWLGQFFWLYALSLLPLSQLIALEFTTPLWVAVLAPLLIGERLTVPRLVAVTLGFVGILIVVRPGAVPLGEGTPFGIGCAIAFALSMIATKRLLQSDNAFTTLFWMQLIQSVLGLAIVLLPALAGYGHGLAIPDPVTFAWLVPVGVMGLTAHYALAKAISYADATIVAPMDFLRLPLFAAVGIFLYGEPLDAWAFVGGMLVVAANILNLRNERRRINTN